MNTPGPLKKKGVQLTLKLNAIVLFFWETSLFPTAQSCHKNDIYVCKIGPCRKRRIQTDSLMQN